MSDEKKIPPAPVAADFDNWKDFAESGMQWQANEQESQSLEELLKRAETQDDGLLWKSIAKKKERAQSSAVLLGALKKFSGDEEGNDSMRYYALEAIFELYKISKKPPEEDQLFLDLFTKPGGSDKWEADFQELSLRVKRKIPPE